MAVAVQNHKPSRAELEASVKALAKSELSARDSARSNLLDFTSYTKSDYEVQFYHRVVCDALDKWITGDIPRLIICLPPRHGKSELCSRRLPAFILGRYPDAHIIATSYSADLAHKMSRDTQNIMSHPSYSTLFPDTMLGDQFARSNAKFRTIRTTDEFEIVEHYGSYRCAGVGGGVAGHGANHLIIDDPVKNREEAESKTFRDKVWNWYTSTLLTRLEPYNGVEGRVLICSTRWHDDDLAGRCIREQNGKNKWVVINLPAISVKDVPNEHDSRPPGVALWENRFPIEGLKRKRIDIGIRDFESLYQGSPKIAEGNLFKRDWWQMYQAPPARASFLSIVQSIDTAVKEGESNDYSVIGTWGITRNAYYLLDVWRDKVEYPGLETAVKSNAAKWTPGLILVEDKSSGQSLIQTMQAETRLPILAVKADKSKLTRANATTGICEAGRVHLPETAVWLFDYIEEMHGFPSVEHDDQVDMTTQLLNWVNALKTQKRTEIQTGDVVEEYGKDYLPEIEGR